MRQFIACSDCVRLSAACGLVVSSAIASAQPFTEVTGSAGIDHVQWDQSSSVLFEGGSPDSAPDYRREVPYMTGAVAVGDINGDHFPDLFFTRFDAGPVLYVNNTDGTFSDVTASSGLAGFQSLNGAAFADLDNDGDQDLYATAVESQRYFLFLNDGDGGFTEAAEQRGAAVSGDSMHMGWSVSVGDIDGDGWLDLVNGEWVVYQQMPDGWSGNAPSHARALRNRGEESPGFFEDITDAAGLNPRESAAHRGFGDFHFVRRLCDFDGDGDQDIYAAGDFGTATYYRNNGDGGFAEARKEAGIGLEVNPMGVTTGDPNGDGFFDLYVTSIDGDEESPSSWDRFGNRLYLNNGDGSFREVTEAAGVAAGYWGWGATFWDFDNDGDEDLVATNGMDVGWADLPALDPFRATPLRVWRNDGLGLDATPVFTEVSADLGITDDGSGKGLAVLDYDRDGDLDLIVANNSATPTLYRNDLETGNAYLRVELIGTASNADGIGALIRVTPDADQPASFQIREITGSSNYLGHNERIAHFGFASRAEPVARIEVEWPSGATSVMESVTPDQTITIVEPCIGADLAVPFGALDGADVNAFVTAFGAGAAPADIDGDGLVDGTDVNAFISAFGAGCP